MYEWVRDIKKCWRFTFYKVMKTHPDVKQNFFLTLSFYPIQ